MTQKLHQYIFIMLQVVLAFFLGMDVFLLQGIFHASACAVTLQRLRVIRDKDTFIKQQTTEVGIRLPLHTQNCTESTVLMASVIQGRHRFERCMHERAAVCWQMLHAQRKRLDPSI